MKTLLASLFLTLALNASAQVQTKSWLEGQHSGVKQPMAAVIHDAHEWRAIWRRHDVSQPAPDVDFSRTNVVVVFLGQTETSGVKVTVVVQQDPLDSNRLNVFYRRTVTKKGFSAQVECQPFAMVKVPAAAAVDVEADGQVSVPEHAEVLASRTRDDGKKVHALIEGLEHLSFDGN